MGSAFFRLERGASFWLQRWGQGNPRLAWERVLNEAREAGIDAQHGPYRTVEMDGIPTPTVHQTPPALLSMGAMTAEPGPLRPLAKSPAGEVTGVVALELADSAGVAQRALPSMSEAQPVLSLAEEGSSAAAALAPPLGVDTVLAARQSVAQNFMRDMGWGDSRIEGHLKGIDFNQPVDLVELQAGQKLQQWQLPDRPTGHYFTDLGIPAEALGINPAGRVANVHVAPRDVVLRSTAAPIVDT